MWWEIPNEGMRGGSEVKVHGRNPEERERRDGGEGGGN